MGRYVTTNLHFHLPFGDDPADAFTGCVEGSRGDESVNHDHYLYGWSKEGGREAPGRHERPPQRPGTS